MEQKTTGQLIVGFLVTAACAALLFAKWKNHEFVDAITLGIFALATVPWLLPFITSLKLPGGFEVAFQKRVEQLEQTSSEHNQIIASQERQLKAQQEMLQQLMANLAKYSISDYIFWLLKGIDQAQLTSGEYKYQQDGSMGRNLRFLMDHGYIAEVYPEPSAGTNLRDVVKITPAGRDLLAIRGTDAPKN
ncbi:MAG TPA: hypothetical protein VN872_02500 [Candidatus Acidoferrum sp.]|jgi:hypothetical protein|nr:hypothetical protein [Candidatus Acidoferrum sp.]